MVKTGLFSDDVTRQKVEKNMKFFCTSIRRACVRGWWIRSVKITIGPYLFFLHIPYSLFSQMSNAKNHAKEKKTSKSTYQAPLLIFTLKLRHVLSCTRYIHFFYGLFSRSLKHPCLRPHWLFVGIVFRSALLHPCEVARRFDRSIHW